MKSEELNAAIREICDDESFDAEIADTGKNIPYIGWFWRTVDFDSETYDFGIIPRGTPSWTMSSGSDDETHGPRTTAVMVGFMENNKWGYPYVHADKDEWANIKELLETAVTERTKESLVAVNTAIQALGTKRYIEDAY